MDRNSVCISQWENMVYRRTEGIKTISYKVDRAPHWALVVSWLAWLSS